MSDFEDMVAMLERAGIEHRVERTDSPEADPRRARDGIVEPIATTITTNDCYRRTTGYPGFWSELFFDADGKLIGIGAWEGAARTACRPP